MTTPLVSVVIPFRTASLFLGECIESVCAQTFGDWEMLLVDDRADDASAEIVRAYVERPSGRIRALQHPRRANRGVGASRNLGLRHARGTYVAFLDADDAWFPTKLEEQLGYLERNPDAALIYGRIAYWYSWTGRPEDADRDFEADMGVALERLYPPPSLVAELIKGKARAPLPSDALLRAAPLRRIGGFAEDRRFSVYEDRVFFTKVELAMAAYAADRCWVRYRQHEDSSSTIVDRQQARTEARREFQRWLERYLLMKGFYRSPLWYVARRSFRDMHPIAAGALGQICRYGTRVGRVLLRRHDAYLDGASVR
jgi:glycosyltransferase involved in cell wall biosynthesis